MLSSRAFQIVSARSPDDVSHIASMFREYSEALGIDLAFQGFDDELAGLPGAYGEPSGVLLVARDQDGCAIGCGALRKLGDEGACEMKRLYVRPAGRGLGLGRALVLALIDAARRRGYREMYLDTLQSMTSARKLYAENGFVPIGPYYDTPVQDTVFMRRTL